MGGGAEFIQQICVEQFGIQDRGGTFLGVSLFQLLRGNPKQHGKLAPPTNEQGYWSVGGTLVSSF